MVVTLPSTSEWGPHLWYVMYLGPKLLAKQEEGGGAADAELVLGLGRYYTELVHIFPCPECKAHYAELIRGSPPRTASSAELRAWLDFVGAEVKKNQQRIQEREMLRRAGVVVNEPEEPEEKDAESEDRRTAVPASRAPWKTPAARRRRFNARPVKKDAAEDPEPKAASGGPEEAPVQQRKRDARPSAGNFRVSEAQRRRLADTLGKPSVRGSGRPSGRVGTPRAPARR